MYILKCNTVVYFDLKVKTPAGLELENDKTVSVHKNMDDSGEYQYACGAGDNTIQLSVYHWN